MANEVNVQAALTLQRDVITLQANWTKSITQLPGSKGILNQMTLPTAGTSSVVLDLSVATNPALASVGFFFLKNADPSTGATPTVDVLLDAVTSAIATLKPGEFCLLPLNRNAASGTGPKILAKPSVNSVSITFGAVEV